jgi:hypothetical protein
LARSNPSAAGREEVLRRPGHVYALLRGDCLAGSQASCVATAYIADIDADEQGVWIYWGDKGNVTKTDTYRNGELVN